MALNETKRQFFTNWEYDKDKDRLFCYYFFRPDPRVAVYSKQLVIHYYDSPRYSDEYTYFYNIEKGKYWGRCTTKHHPQHNPAIMQWHFFTQGGMGRAVTPGSPPIPGSQDRAAMTSPPDPPL